jgi:hypothetical protein
MLKKLVSVLALASIIGLSAVVAVAMIPGHVQASTGGESTTTQIQIQIT